MIKRFSTRYALNYYIQRGEPIIKYLASMVTQSTYQIEQHTTSDAYIYIMEDKASQAGYYLELGQQKVFLSVLPRSTAVTDIEDLYSRLLKDAKVFRVIHRPRGTTLIILIQPHKLSGPYYAHYYHLYELGEPNGPFV